MMDTYALAFGEVLAQQFTSDWEVLKCNIVSRVTLLQCISRLPSALRAKSMEGIWRDSGWYQYPLRRARPTDLLPLTLQWEEKWNEKLRNLYESKPISKEEEMWGRKQNDPLVEYDFLSRSYGFLGFRRIPWARINLDEEGQLDCQIETTIFPIRFRCNPGRNDVYKMQGISVSLNAIPTNRTYLWVPRNSPEPLPNKWQRKASFDEINIPLNKPQIQIPCVKINPDLYKFTAPKSGDQVGLKRINLIEYLLYEAREHINVPRATSPQIVACDRDNLLDVILLRSKISMLCGLISSFNLLRESLRSAAPTIAEVLIDAAERKSPSQIRNEEVLDTSLAQQ